MAMAFHKKTDYMYFARLLIVTVLTFALVSTENIDCYGKAFHCVNSTHFKICVDFGGGISKTVDEFLISCPINTVCRDIDKFECEHQATTTLASIEQGDVANEQVKLSVTSARDKIDVTTLFPEYKTIVIEQLKIYNNSSISATESTSSVVSNDAIDFISSITLDERLNQVNLTSENNVQYNKKSDLSVSATISYDPASTFGLVTNQDEFSTITTKVTLNDSLLNDESIQILEGVTKTNIGLVTLLNSTNLNVSNNAEHNFPNNTVTLTSLVTRINNLSTQTEFSKSSTPYSAETDLNTVTLPLSVSEKINIENDVANDSSINLNYITTTDSYSTDKEQMMKSDGGTISTPTYNNKSLSSGAVEAFNNIKSNFTTNSTFIFEDDATTPINTKIYSSTENTLSKSSTNVFNRNLYSSNINHDNISNRTETLFTSSSPINKITATTPVKEFFENTNENLAIKNILHYKFDNLNTPITNNINQQNFENVVTRSLDNTDLYSLKKYENTSPISDESHIVVNLTESIPTTTDTGLLSENLINTTITTKKSITNDLLQSNTSLNHNSVDILDLSISKRDYKNVTTINLKTSDTLAVQNEDDVSLNISDTFPINDLTNVSLQNLHPINVTNETLYLEVVSTDDRLTVKVNNTNAENDEYIITDITDFIENKTTFVIENTSIATTLIVNLYNTTNTKQLYPVLKLDMNAPLITTNSSNVDVGLDAKTTLQYMSPSKSYQSTTIVNSDAYRNQENKYLVSPSQNYSDINENEIVSTTDVTTTIYFDLENKNKTLENITNTKETAASISISNKNNEYFKIDSAPLIVSTQIISINPVKISILNKTMLHIPNINNNSNTHYEISEPIPVNQSAIKNVLHTTQINEEFNLINVSLNKVNTTANYSLANVDLITKVTLPILKQDFRTLKTYENEAKTHINTNEIITTSEAVTRSVNTNVFVTGHVEATKMYSDTQNILATTNIYQQETLTKVASLSDKNNRTSSDQKDVTNSNPEVNYNLLAASLNTLKNTTKIQNLNASNKEAMFETDAISRLPFENVFAYKTLGVASKPKNIAQTTSHAMVSKINDDNTLSTNSNNVNGSHKRITTIIKGINFALINASNVEKITEATSKDLLTRHIINITAFDSNSTNNDDSLKYNSTSLLKQNVANSNDTFIKLLENDKNQLASLKKYDYFSNKGLLQDIYYDETSIKKPSIPTTTLKSFTTVLIYNGLNLNKQTTSITAQFTCLNRDRGKYSDRNNCNKFFICVGKLQPIIGMCPADTVFSEIKKQCTKNLSHCIRNNQFRCLSPGRFIDVLSEKFYYICVKILDGYVRFKLQCQKGYYLNKENIQCSSDTKSVENISKTISDKSTKEKISKEIAHSGSYEIQFDCEKEGKFEHPNDCRKYFVCTKNSKSKFRRKIKKCDSDEIFNKEKRKCVDSDSYEC